MGGMGGYGSMYGGGMYGGMGGMPGDPNNPNSLTNGFTQSTQATFQIIESIVGAFGGFAQMLESTYMATHSSFFGKPLTLIEKAVCVPADNRSNGVCGRAIWKSQKYPWVDIRNICDPALDEDFIREAHRKTTSSRCHGVDSKCLCQI